MQKMALIVEDNDETRELLKLILKKEGYLAFEAENGRKALVYLGLESPGSEEEKKLPCVPDLILLDVMLPEVDGYTILSRIQTENELSKIPVIVITAKSSVADLFVSYPNVKHFFVKPFDVDILRKKIKEILG